MPPAVVTVTSTVPALPAGAVAVICVALSNVKPLALVAPNLTAVTPLKFEPVMMTLVPPAKDPEFGEMPLTAGRAT